MLADPNAPTHPGRGPAFAPEPMAPSGSAVPPRPGPRLVWWLRRLGVAGFLFFFIKGLLWLALPAMLALWRHLER